MIEAARESTTLKIVIVLLLTEIGAFLMSYRGENPMDIMSFAQATGITVALWLGREWRKAAYK